MISKKRSLRKRRAKKPAPQLFTLPPPSQAQAPNLPRPFKLRLASRALSSNVSQPSTLPLVSLPQALDLTRPSTLTPASQAPAPDLPQLEMEVDPTTSQSQVPSPSTQKTCRGGTFCHKVYKQASGEKIVLKLNNYGQPIEAEGGAYAHFLGTLARNSQYFPIDVPSWHAMPTTSKDRAWEFAKTKFVLSDEVKRWTLSSLASSWKDWKHKLAKKYYDPDIPIENQLNCPDKRVEAEQWKNYLRYYNTDKARKMRETNKVNRAKKKVGHATGTKSYSRVRDEEEKKGVIMDRIQFFKKTHLKKDGTPVDAASGQLMEAMEKLSSQQIAVEGSQSSTLAKDDEFAKLAGEERHGRVRTMGKGVIPSKLWGREPTGRGVVKELRAENTELKVKVGGLEQQMNDMRDICSTLQAQVQALFAKEVIQEDLPTSDMQSSDASHDVAPQPARPTTRQLPRPCRLTFPGSGVVAHGLLMSEDPVKEVGGKPLDVGWVEVLLNNVLAKKIGLFIPHGSLKTLGDAHLQGKPIAWLRELVIEEDKS